MDEVLNNPVWHALNSGNSHLAIGTGNVKYFDSDVSPFAALRENNEHTLRQLYELLPNNRVCFLATLLPFSIPPEFEVAALVPGIQMLHNGVSIYDQAAHVTVNLSTQHCNEMVELAKLTKPGPFDMRTIEFGHYQGIFSNNKLVAMAGQRMHAFNYAEISAVCTHPDFAGKGYARRLLINQINRIISAGNIPFLHARGDNNRAIDLYQSLGFSKRSDMYFYILKKNKQFTTLLHLEI